MNLVNRIHAIFIIVILFFTSISFAQTSPHQAAKNADLELLRQMRFNGINLYEPNEGGFIPYEMAALWADPEKQELFKKHVGIMMWLKEFKPQKHTYGKASIKLTQAGLNMLGFDGGSVDGVIGERTKRAIIDYQKEIEVGETGTLGPHWLGAMYQDVLKELQTRLTALGYDTKGNDGLMGPRTQVAILAFREEHGTNNSNYKGIDADLISTINIAIENKNKAYKKAQVQKERKTEENETRFLQAGLTTLGYNVGKVDGMNGGRTKRALTKWQKRHDFSARVKLTGEAKETFRKSVIKVTQQKLNALGYKTGKPDGLLGKSTLRALSKFGSKFNTPKNLNNKTIVKISQAFNTMKATNKLAEKKAEKATSRKKAARIAAQKKAKALAVKKKRKQTKKKATTVVTKKNKPKDLSKLPLAKTIPLSGKKANSGVKVEATIRKPVTSDIIKPVSKTKPQKNKIIPIKMGKSSTGARKVQGRMTFRKSGGSVVGCAISGRNLPIEWCEPFYPLPKNNRCRAMFKSNGSVIEVKCN